MTGRAAAIAVMLLSAGCQAPAAAAPATTATPATSVPATALPTTSPTPQLPPYYIESLRARAYPGGKLQLGELMFRGAGFTKYQMSWPSGGQTMTGTISIPDGDGPFPVVVVNHGYIPPDRYWIGQDSGIFGDPLASHGFIAVAPNWPGYAGSGPAPPELPAIVGEVVSALDLVSSMATFPRADASRVAFIGHSNGGGVALIAMVVDPRIAATVLYAPVSSDMADNARKWWLRSGQQGPMGTPESNPEGYAHLSPRNYFAAGQPPVLILQGDRDQDIPAAWTLATYEALRSRGVETELAWFPGALHDLVGADLARANALSEEWIRRAPGRRGAPSGPSG